MKPQITESGITILSEGTRLEGKFHFDQITRVHGVLAGEVFASEGSTLILTETAMLEGNIDADTVMIDGFVRGDIQARTRVVISGTGRVIGDIKTPSLSVAFGAHFEGRCAMQDESEGAPTGAPSLSPA